MINKLTVYETDSTQPWRNIAMEAWLMQYVSPGECVLYLWQNKNTVVVGRNQNIFDECRLAELTGAGGTPARRLSGGGAVYHDMGNQNFTFIVKKEDYDVVKQTEVIIKAAELLGINAEKTGRNDITVNDRKFSGHAYYESGGVCYHHGTLMVDVEIDEMSRFLRPSPEKLKSKGVSSVRSRVANLSEFHTGLTPEMMRDAMRKAFAAVYGISTTEMSDNDIDGQAVARYEKKFSSSDWLYNRVIDAEHIVKKRFDWGEMSIAFTSDNGVITDAAVSSDGLDADLLASVPQRIAGCNLDKKSLVDAIMHAQYAGSYDAEKIANDIADLILQSDL